ncbi:MAG: hypothetical protein HAW61_00755 [Candidatus Portiera sp.]|nr:hypothetical protein [Portiera sp.]
MKTNLKTNLNVKDIQGEYDNIRGLPIIRLAPIISKLLENKLENKPENKLENK